MGRHSRRFYDVGVIKAHALCNAWLAMDLDLTCEQEALRSELRDWLAAHLPAEYGSGLPPRLADLSKAVELGRRWQAKLAEARWVAVTWPVEYGGRGLGAVEHFLVAEELARYRAPELVGRIGINLVGPTLLAHGSEEQRRRWMPPILSAEELWCQLFSEPDAGSDLASLSTRAEEVEGGFLVTGRKVWTSYAQFADWGLCLARTGPGSPRRHDGISALAVDMHAAGVQIHPLVQITGDAEFNEVILEEVFVPASNLIGTCGQGWAVASSTLAHERGTAFPFKEAVVHEGYLTSLYRQAQANGALEDPVVADALAQSYIELGLLRLENLRTLSRLERGEDPGPDSSRVKLIWTSMTQQLSDAALLVCGPGSGSSLSGTWQRQWLWSRAASIAGGTSEIQRDIIANRILGLPRH
ncbi:MAG: acyl-CoA dehydrogenase family protein [Actinobacteria bacterium]|nr:acyl-CoA dehydrogenase family protein [Actinomycetota bacterium]